jgi:zinc protease
MRRRVLHLTLAAALATGAITAAAGQGTGRRTANGRPSAGVDPVRRGQSFSRSAFLSSHAAVGPQPSTLGPRHSAGSPPPDTLTTEFDVAGLHVILRRNTANEVVAANLYLLGGTRQVTPATEGIEPFLLAASERGTRHYPGVRARQAVEALGSEIGIDATEDWTRFGFHAVQTTFDSTWMVFTDRLMAPTLDSTEVALVQAQLLAGARTLRDSPDALVHWLADSVAFAGHPYGLEPIGSETSLSSLTAADLRRYHDTQLETSRMLLVVVGNIERPRLETLITMTLSHLPRGSYRWTPPALPTGQHAAAVVVSRTLPTNYILGRYAGPPASSPDYQALRIATAVLNGRLFTEIRSRRNLTYAVEAPFEEHAIATGGLYVTTVSPDTTLAIMRSEVARLKRETIDREGLRRLVQGFITQYYLDTETNAAQGDRLARAALYRGDYHTAERFVDELRRVTPDDVRRVASKYMRDVRWAYIGDPSKVSRSRMMDL